MLDNNNKIDGGRKRKAKKAKGVANVVVFAQISFGTLNLSIMTVRERGREKKERSTLACSLMNRTQHKVHTHPQSRKNESLTPNM